MTLRQYGATRSVLVAGLLLAVAAPVWAQSGGRIVGLIVDDEGNPMEGVSIIASVVAAERRAADFETKTGSDGRFSIIGFVSGEWLFTAEFEGYQTVAANWKVTQGRNQPVNLTLARIKHPLELALGEEAFEGLDPEVLEAELNQADEAFNDQRYDEAIEGYTSLLAQVPAFTMLHVQIGNALTQKNEYQNAIASYERALAEEPENGDAKAGIARAKLSMGDFEAASAELEAAASGLNAEKEDLYNLGELEFAQGDVDAAAGWYEKASMADPNWGKPLFKLALVALNKGDTETAKEFFQQVLDVDPNSDEGAQAKATLSALP